MHDIKAIRENPEAFDAGLALRGLAPRSSELLAMDADVRAVTTRLQTLQARRNEASKLIGKAKASKDEAEAQRLMAEVATLKDDLTAGEAEERERQKALSDVLAAIPNIPAADVPPGKDEHDNVEKREYLDAIGPNRLTQPGSNRLWFEHFDLGEVLGQMNFEVAAKMSGARFVVLKRDLARMERALANFMLDLQTGEFGYEEVSPPMLVRDEAMFGTGQLPKFKDDLFPTSKAGEYSYDDEEIYGQAVQNLIDAWAPDDFPNIELYREMSRLKALKQPATRLWLIPTAEVSLTNIVRESILSDQELPKRFTAHTPCFRSEAGSAGRDTRGMIRMHQFSKVELVSITTPDKSDEEHERMTNCAEEVLKRLGLAFRTMTLCAGDMGFSARKTYDIEVWLPGQNRYREISSCSNCGDFQARRMDARYRPAGEKGTRFVHTLNGSGLAVGRTLIAVMENYQQEDGSIAIPDVLKPYMGGLEKIGG